MAKARDGLLAALRGKGRMGPGWWDDKPGAGRIAPMRKPPVGVDRFRDPGPLAPARRASFWAGLWVGLSLGLAAGYGLVIWCVSRLL